MKAIIKITLAAILCLGLTFAYAQNNKKVKTATYSAVMHSNSCVQKIEKNIPFEKGIKDVRINFDKQQVAIDYYSDKTNTDAIQKAFDKIKIDAKLLEAKK